MLNLDLDIRHVVPCVWLSLVSWNSISDKLLRGDIICVYTASGKGSITQARRFLLHFLHQEYDTKAEQRLSGTHAEGECQKGERMGIFRVSRLTAVLKHKDPYV